MLRHWMSTLRDAAPANPYGAMSCGGQDGLAERLAARIVSPTKDGRSAVQPPRRPDPPAPRRSA